MLASAAGAVLFQLVLHTDVVITHFMYIPIAQASMWWGVKGTIAAGVLAATVVCLNLAGLGSGTMAADAARGGFFILVAFFIGVLRNRLMHGQRALEQTEARFRRLIDESLIGIFVHRNGRVLFANDRFCRMIGISRDEVKGVELSRFMSAEDAQCFSRGLSCPRNELRFRTAGGAGGQELTGRREEAGCREGACVWVVAAGSPAAWDGEEAMLVNVVDITERKESEELARRQEEQLVHSTRLAELGEMAAAISHELNQPLTGIRNYARNAFYMIDKKLGDEAEVKDNLRLISEQVDRASKIINQMRELTRRTDRTFTSLDVNSVIRETVEFLLPQMKLSEVDVILELAPDLPRVTGDRIRLAQVMLNLLTNARHAMEESPLRKLVIRSYAAGAPPSMAAPTPVPPWTRAGSEIVMEVVDSGRGFTEEEARRFFVPFYTTKKNGHGLGLSISRAIITDHQGTIEARGEPGAGAVFTVRLPDMLEAPVNAETANG